MKPWGRGVLLGEQIGILMAALIDARDLLSEIDATKARADERERIEQLVEQARQSIREALGFIEQAWRLQLDARLDGWRKWLADREALRVSERPRMPE